MARWFVLALVSPATAAEPRGPRNWRFALPAGTPSAGEQVFVKMRL